MWMPLPGWESWPDMFPTIVTSSPSRIQTVPRPMMIIQCHRDHGSRSNRAGILVVTVPVCTLFTLPRLSCSQRYEEARYPVTTPSIREEDRPDHGWLLRSRPV